MMPEKMCSAPFMHNSSVDGLVQRNEQHGGNHYAEVEPNITPQKAVVMLSNSTLTSF